MTTSSSTAAPYADPIRTLGMVAIPASPEVDCAQLEVAPHLANQTNLAQLVASYLDTRLASLSPQQVFWGLNDRWWMQIIDGKDHQFGSQVYDQGLHGRQVEPGFYRGIQSACELASAHLLARPTVSFYQQLHRTACAHFTGDRSAGVQISAADTGVFRSAGICRGTIDLLYSGMTVADREAIERMDREQARLETDRHCWDAPFFQKHKAATLDRYGLTEAEFFERSAAAPVRRRALFQRFDDKITWINTYIAERSRALGASCPIAELVRNDTGLTVYYRCPRSEIEAVVERLFAEFDRNIARATSRDERIRSIADLVQMLEYLHPFEDGQTRTDLVLLTQLLCQHGLNPTILQNPNVIPYRTLDEWVELLKNGMEQWQREFSRNPLPTAAAAPTAGGAAAVAATPPR